MHIFAVALTKAKFSFFIPQGLRHSNTLDKFSLRSLGLGLVNEAKTQFSYV
jgi:hypothetical protein